MYYIYEMMKNKYISRLLNGFFILAVGLFLLDHLSSFDIKSQPIKSFAYFGVLVLAPLALVWNLWNSKTPKRKIISIIVPILTILGILLIGPIKIIFSSSSWKTQKILYQNEHSEFKKVEFQMQDVGASGYNRRTVKVTYLTNFFMIIDPVEKDIDKHSEWIKIDKEINELGLKSQ